MSSRTPAPGTRGGGGLPDLSGTYAPKVGIPSIVGTGHGVTADKAGNWIVKGFNLGKTSAATSTAFWTTNYNFTGIIQPVLDGMVATGANTVRITGSYTAYSQDPATHKERTHRVWDYAKSLGLQIVYAWMNWNQDSLASADRAAYQAMAADMIVGYVGDPDFLAWELGNEIPAGSNSDALTLVQNFAADLRALDATTKITGGGNAFNRVPDVTAYDPIVDFHDIHVYVTLPDTDVFAEDLWAQVRSATSKPFLMGEFGANNNPNNGDGFSDTHQVAAFYRAMRRYVVGDVMGALVWNYMDDGDGTWYGVYDLSGNPRPSLAEVLRYPDRNMAVAADLVAYRTSPVLLDNFARPDSATSPGTSPIGGAGSVGLGTWGVSGRALYLAASDASNDNFYTWDTHSGDIELEIEFTPNTTYANLGMVLRWVDTGTYLLAQWTSDAGFWLTPRNGGTFGTKIGPFACPMKGLGRLRVVAKGQQIALYAYDRLLSWTNGVSAPAITGTRHGVWIKGGPVSPGDGGSKITRVSGGVPLRTF